MFDLSELFGKCKSLNTCTYYTTEEEMKHLRQISWNSWNKNFIPTNWTVVQCAVINHTRRQNINELDINSASLGKNLNVFLSFWYLTSYFSKNGIWNFKFCSLFIKIQCFWRSLLNKFWCFIQKIQQTSLKSSFYFEDHVRMVATWNHRSKVLATSFKNWSWSSCAWTRDYICGYSWLINVQSFNKL